MGRHRNSRGCREHCCFVGFALDSGLVGSGSGSGSGFGSGSGSRCDQKPDSDSGSGFVGADARVTTVRTMIV